MSWTKCPNCGNSVKSDDIFCQSCGIELNKKSQTQFMPSHSRTAEYRGYIQILGTVEIVFGVIALLLSILIAIIGLSFPLLLESDMFDDEIGNHSMLNEEFFGIFIAIILLLIALAVLIFAIGSILSGKRLMDFKNSGRTGTMIIGALYLLMFPLGTIFGIAVLYVLTRPEVEPLFR